MENNEEINMGDDVTRFCVSWITMWVMSEATKQFIQAWNCHRIPGPNGGVPCMLAKNCVTSHIGPNSISSTVEMVQLHEQNGARLTRDTQFGCDLLHNYPTLWALREGDFHVVCSNSNNVFENILHGNGQLFKDCLLFFIFLTRRFASLLP